MMFVLSLTLLLKHTQCKNTITSWISLFVCFFIFSPVSHTIDHFFTTSRGAGLRESSRDSSLK